MVLADWLTGFVRSEADPVRIQQWVDRIETAIRAELPEASSQPLLAEALHTAVHENWLAFLAAFDKAEFRFKLVEGGRLLAEQVAAHQLPLEWLVKVYRAAQQEAWAYVTDVVKSIDDPSIDTAEVLIYFWGRAGSWIDAAIGDSIEVFQNERIRVMAGEAAQRYEVVREILGGAELDPKRASAALGGYPLSVVHTGLVLVTDNASSVSDLDRVAHEGARSLGAGQPLIVHPGGRQVWAWVGTRHEPDLDRLRDLQKRLAAVHGRMFVGIPAADLEGFRTTHHDAEKTAAVAQRGGAWAPVMKYEDVEILALLGCDEQVDRFVRRTLGNLAADDDGTQRVRETVSAFLRHSGNVEDAAEELCVHRNTIRYRLGRAEEVLGHPVPRYGAELMVALRHHEIFHRAGD